MTSLFGFPMKDIFSSKAKEITNIGNVFIICFWPHLTHFPSLLCPKTKVIFGTLSMLGKFYPTNYKTTKQRKNFQKSQFFLVALLTLILFLTTTKILTSNDSFKVLSENYFLTKLYGCWAKKNEIIQVKNIRLRVRKRTFLNNSFSYHLTLWAAR